MLAANSCPVKLGDDDEQPALQKEAGGCGKENIRVGVGLLVAYVSLAYEPFVDPAYTGPGPLFGLYDSFAQLQTTRFIDVRVLLGYRDNRDVPLRLEPASESVVEAARASDD